MPGIQRPRRCARSVLNYEAVRLSNRGPSVRPVDDRSWHRLIKRADAVSRGNNDRPYCV